MRVRLAAVIGFLDSIVSAKQNAAKYQYSISPNRELVALGIANLAGSFVPGTLPAAGSITRWVNPLFSRRDLCKVPEWVCNVGQGSMEMLERGHRWPPWFVPVSCFSPPSFCFRCCITCPWRFWLLCESLRTRVILTSRLLTELRSVCLVLISLIAEIPEAIKYYWRSVYFFD